MLPDAEINQNFPYEHCTTGKDQRVSESHEHGSSPPSTIMPRQGRRYTTMTFHLESGFPKLLAASMAAPVSAAAEKARQAVQDRIIAAFDPIKELLQGVSYPICLLMIMGGMILVMIGQRKRGIEMIKWAVVGYLGLQFAPVLMGLVVDVARAMAAK